MGAPLIEYDMEFRGRLEAYHPLPDALLQLPQPNPADENADDMFFDDSSSWNAYQGPAAGPILDGIPLSDLRVDIFDMPITQCAAAAAVMVLTPVPPEASKTSESIRRNVPTFSAHHPH